MKYGDQTSGWCAFAGRFDCQIVRFLIAGEKIARLTWIGGAAYRKLLEQEFADGPGSRR